MFLDKYISKRDYDNFVKDGILSDGFSLEEHNSQVINKLYDEYLEYFKNMYQDIDSNIILDEEQIKAILCDEDYTFILAGAGTGKTTTMVSKVKYLVEKKHVDPKKILVMSFTKKATEELENRIVYDFKIPANVTTFHSLGLSYVRRIYSNRYCYVVDDAIKDEIFLNYFKERLFPYKEKLKEIIEIFSVNKYDSFLFGKFFRENYYKYEKFEDFFQEYKEFKLSQIPDLHEWITGKIDKMVNAVGPRTIKNELVKSKKEALIANFLFEHNVVYHYEKIYDELMDDRKTYKPDFTLDFYGDEVYLEYFGIQDTTSKIGFRYLQNKEQKEHYHKMRHTKHIFLEPMENDEIFLLELECQLKDMGFSLEKRSDLEIYHQLMDNNPVSQVFKFKNFLYTIIDKFKTVDKRNKYQEIVINYLDTLNGLEKEVCQKQFLYVHEFYSYYQESLFGSDKYGFDYADMIYYASLYMDRLSIGESEYDYLVVDEYQDISQNRYEFTKKIVDRNHAKIVAVGDDWQTIYSFAGSKIEYVYDFEKYYPGAKILRINRTYRNSQQLIECSGNFIMKNDNQLKKELVSEKKLEMPIKFIMYKEHGEYEALKKLILMIHEKNKEHNILILARTNKSIYKMYFDNELKDGLDTKVEFVGHDDLQIDGMTIHKSKGLTSDEVIVIGLDESFPSNKSDYWLISLFQNKTIDESIAFAEERRLFYVALTRTKNYVYLLVNENVNHRSEFVNEIYEISKKMDQDDVLCV